MVPKITAIFEDSGKALPWNTQLLIFVAGLTGSYWWAAVRRAVAGLLGFRRWARTPGAAHHRPAVSCGCGWSGTWCATSAVARFARTLATMLASGVPLLTALEIVKKVLDNVVLEKVIEEARDAIREGESIAAHPQEVGAVPVDDGATWWRWASARASWRRCWRTWPAPTSATSRCKVTRLTTMLSPLMIVVMALGVGVHRVLRDHADHGHAELIQ